MSSVLSHYNYSFLFPSLILVSTDNAADLPALKNVIKVDVHCKGCAELDQSASFNIPPATVLSYSCNEFSIGENGIPSLHAAVDSFDKSGEPLLLNNLKTGDPGVYIIFMDYLN